MKKTLHLTVLFFLAAIILSCASTGTGKSTTSLLTTASMDEFIRIFPDFIVKTEDATGFGLPSFSIKGIEKYAVLIRDDQGFKQVLGDSGLDDRFIDRYIAILRGYMVIKYADFIEGPEPAEFREQIKADKEMNPEYRKAMLAKIDSLISQYREEARALKEKVHPADIAMVRLYTAQLRDICKFPVKL